MEQEADLTIGGSTCLICSSLFERRPKAQESGGLDEHLSEFKSAFKLFSKLIETQKQEKEDDQQWMMILSKFFASACKIKTMLQTSLDDAHFRTFTPPCCGDCYYALVEIYRLQRVIDENQVSQQNLVNSLAKSLIEKKLPGTRKGGKRQYSASLEMEDSSSSRKKRKIGPKSRTTSISVIIHQKPRSVERKNRLSNVKNWSRVLERCDQRKEPKKKDTKKKDTKVSELEETSDDNASSGQNLEAASPAKDYSFGIESDPDLDSFTKVKLEKFGENDGEPEPPEKRKKKTFKTFLGLSHDQIYGVDDSSRRIPRSNWFFQVNENILLLKSSLIQVCREENKMICLESKCDFAVHTMDSLSCFQEMREHIYSHLVENKYSKWWRPCPICKMVCGADVKFHFLKSHRQTVSALCEVCWAPFSNPAKLQPHIWTHKSEEEKREAEARGESETNAGHKLKSFSIKKQRKDGGMKNLKNKVINGEHTRSETRDCLEPDYFKNGKPKKNKLSKFGLSQEKIDRPKSRRIARSHWFYLIGEDYLILKNSLIKITHSEKKLTCLESGCKTIIRGLGYSSFQQLREHIDSHLLERNYASKLRACPICGKKCEISLKMHFMKRHLQSIAVLCEVCRKPLPSTQLIQPHLWSHKSAEEKKEAEARGETETNSCFFQKMKSLKKRKELRLKSEVEEGI